MRTFHDYHLVGYTVDGENREITLYLAWLYPEAVSPRPREKLTFRQVEGYFLEHDVGVNVVYSIEETEIEEHIHSQTNLFEEHSNWGWPPCWRGSAERTLKYLKDVGAKCFVLTTSLGLSGWIVCRESPEAATL